ncbi:DUF5703 domain-containing protein [Paenibacillus cymbidii]|uniref:DUF5703 domain-containing protein n=1 Tax=Paenibacillus cymbidii TaxID=1639034 RepID=UPI00108207F3|nr:DUF5703 domain-containing protein [Paenibacillus cymbidii]
MDTRHDVVWETPSGVSSGSMPLGNGDIGLNVWAGQDGSLFLLIAKTDAWDENGSLLKLGRIRITATLAGSRLPVGPPAAFRQTLRLADGEIAVAIGEAGEQIRYRIWVDAHQPVARIEAEADREIELQVANESWRTERRPLAGSELHMAYGLKGGAAPIIVEADTVHDAKGDELVWYHRNERSVWADNMRLQGLPVDDERFRDPLLRRTFGVLARGDGLARSSLRELASSRPAASWRLALFAHCAQTETVDDWLRQLEQSAAACVAIPLETSRERHRAWWRAFWQRSWIASDDERVTGVLQGYVLQRYMNACAGRGTYPIKFNGSIFTMELDLDSEHLHLGRENYNPDYRRWGGPYWFQNTRLIYWSMLAAGDFDLMQPFFKLYRDALPLAQLRTTLYYGHEGAYFPETMNFWGTYANDNYGWNREGMEPGIVANAYIRHYLQGGLELLAIMLDYASYADDEDFVRHTLQPMATAVLDFYDRHYPRDGSGALTIEPASSLETWHEAVNPLPEIAGLHFVLDRLLVDGPIRDRRLLARWRRLLAKLPHIPQRGDGDETVLLPAEQVMGPIMNSENPELYAVFPYPLYAIGTPGAAIGRRTYAARLTKRTGGWSQDAIQSAYLGLAEESLRDVASNFQATDPAIRFPAFWGPSFDWVPDQDTGSVAMIALQAMLIQCRGGRIHVLLAWPQHIDVAFRLHADSGTTVEAEYRNGTLVRCVVEPPSRAADIVIGSGPDAPPTVR